MGYFFICRLHIIFVDYYLKNMQTLKDNIRQNILDSARHEFSQYKFEKASIRRIAQNAGITSGTIYSYFKSKDELFCEVLSPLMKELNSYMTESMTPESKIESKFEDGFIERTIDKFMLFVNTERVLLKILLFNAQGSSLENYKYDITERVVHDSRLFLANNQRRHPEMNADICDATMRLHTLLMFSTFEEIIIHKMTKEEMRKMLEEFTIFEFYGWKNALNM